MSQSSNARDTQAVLDCVSTRLKRRNDALLVTDDHVVNEVLRDNQYRLSSDFPLENAVFVDVGGHIGAFSAAALALFDTASVLAYEPDPENFALLVKNLAGEIEQNRARCFNAAVDAREGDLGLCVNPANRGASTTHVLTEGDGAIAVKAHSIVAILDTIDNERDVVLKLDCEGAEYPILDALSPNDLGAIGLIVLELHFTPDLARQGRDPAALLDRLAKAGFSVWVLEEIVYASEGVFWIVVGVNGKFSHLGAINQHYAAAAPSAGGDVWYQRLAAGREGALRNGLGWPRGKLWLAMTAGAFGWGTS